MVETVAVPYVRVAGGELQALQAHASYNFGVGGRKAKEVFDFVTVDTYVGLARLDLPADAALPAGSRPRAARARAARSRCNLRTSAAH